MKTVYLKLGGSLITDKSSERVFRDEVVCRLGEEIRSALDEKPMRLLIGHGAGCFGHVPAKRYQVKRGLRGGGGWEGYSETRRAVIELNGLVLEAFARADLRPIAVQPSAIALARNGEIVKMDTTVIERIFESGQIPMIFGDAVLDEDLGFTIVSTEGFFRHLAGVFPPSSIVMACDVDGVFNSDPNVDPDAWRIPRIDSKNIDEVLEGLTEGKVSDVTGGMAGKVRAAYDLACEVMDCEVRIVTGVIADRVRDALTGRGGGTRVRA